MGLNSIKFPIFFLDVQFLNGYCLLQKNLKNQNIQQHFIIYQVQYSEDLNKEHLNNGILLEQNSISGNSL